MKKTVKTILSIFITIMAIATISVASNNMVEVKAKMDYETKMMFNGNVYAPTNANNEVLRPIVSKGVIYLPTAIVEDVFNTNLVYDIETKELWLSEKNEKSYFSSNELNPDTLRDLYYTENPKECYVDNKMFKTALKAKLESSEYSDYYFHTGKLAGEINKMGGYIYIDKKTDLDVVNIKFRKSKDENSEILEYLKIKPGEVTEFEIDTRGANIVVMDHDSQENDHTDLVNFSILDLYYK